MKAKRLYLCADTLGAVISAAAAAAYSYLMLIYYKGIHLVIKAN